MSMNAASCRSLAATRDMAAFKATAARPNPSCKEARTGLGGCSLRPPMVSRFSGATSAETRVVREPLKYHGRARNGDCSPPAAQILACVVNAPGSHLGSWRRTASRDRGAAASGWAANVPRSPSFSPTSAYAAGFAAGVSAASGRARGKVLLPCSRSGSKTALEAAQPPAPGTLENPWFSTYPPENLLF
jgi:hypothetical protein